MVSVLVNDLELERIMSVMVTKVDGKAYSINITGDDVGHILKGIYELIDSYSEHCTENEWPTFKESNEAKSLYLLTREY